MSIVSVTMSDHICISCGVPFAMPDRLEAARRADHAWFYCPNGHQARYGQPTAAEKRVAELEALLAQERAGRKRDTSELKAKLAEVTAKQPAVSEPPSQEASEPPAALAGDAKPARNGKGWSEARRAATKAAWTPERRAEASKRSSATQARLRAEAFGTRTPAEPAPSEPAAVKNSVE